MQFTVLGTIFLFAANVVRASQGDEKRIIKGRVADIGEFPYQVSIEVLGRHSCGGTIIHPQIIITAAHCVQILSSPIKVHPRAFTVRAGANVAEEDGIVYKVISYIYHPDFHKDPIVSDVALLLLERPIVLNPNAQPIPLIRRLTAAGEAAVVTGYGRTVAQRSERVLRMITIPIVSWDVCKSILQKEGEVVSSGMMCAGLDNGKDACQGDSGGPLVVDGMLAGITSWGIGCGRVELPGIYTNTYSFLPWITESADRLIHSLVV